jgi:hypothetical protein
MHQKTILSLGAAFCLSLTSLVSGQETDKAALLAEKQAREKLQKQVNTEKNRIVNRVGQRPVEMRKKALANQVKASTILQQARAQEEGENPTQGLGKASPEPTVSKSEIIKRINSLPVAERRNALREAMKELKGKKLEN